MPKYVLTYFDSPGRAVTTRHMFAQAGIEFEDKRVGGESWLAIKPNCPLKQLPILDVDGVTICQSPAIERYVAKVCGLYGSNDEEVCQIDQIHTTSGELASFLIPLFFGEISKDEEKKEELRKSLVTEKLPTWFNFLETKLVANGGGDGYFVGSSVSLADIFWANMCKFVQPVDKEGTLAAAYPKVFALGARVHDLPAIKEWNAKHQK